MRNNLRPREARSAGNMFRIEKTEPPSDSLLKHYAEIDGCYTDCYVVDIDCVVSFPDFVTAFYGTWLFKLERFVLAHFASRPSTDEQARQVANSQIDHFAAWRVEDRAKNQLLMCDMSERTRSWFMTAPISDQSQNPTRLYFGSAVVPRDATRNEKPSLGFIFTALLGFHKLYSRALLSAAKTQLMRSQEIEQSL